MKDNAPGVFCDLHPAIRDAIGEFQSYVAALGNAARWPRAQSLIQRVADEVHYATGSAPRPSLDKVAAMFRCECVLEQQRVMKRAASLEPKAGGFVVRIFRSNDSDQQTLFDLESGSSECAATRSLSARDRFTLAHELGHALFYHSDGRTAKPQKLPVAKSSDRNEWRIEGLCHDFARALLIPQASRNSGECAPATARIASLAKEFEVTEEPLVRRVMHDWGCWPDAFVVVFRLRQRGLLVTVFRGRNRRRDRNLPSARVLEELVSNVPSIDAISPCLDSFFGVRCDCRRVGQESLWAVIPA